ncbi:hypothetical protein BDQ12DRAFT_685417, partial [Crucibulum laeve]
LFSISHVPLHCDVRRSFRVAVWGQYLPAFSKALLHDGQVYYLISLSGILSGLALFYSKNIPMAYKAIIPSVSFIIANIMACRVFRNAKLDLYSYRNDPYQSNITTALDFSGNLRNEETNRGTVHIPLSLYPRHSNSVNSNGRTRMVENDCEESSIIDTRKKAGYSCSTPHADTLTSDSGEVKFLKTNDSFV